MSVAQRAPQQTSSTPTSVEVSIVMPCLNEAETLAKCIRHAQNAIAKSHLAAEIIVADNGSTDGSQQIAKDLGARVVDVSRKGYGSALIGGIDAAQGLLIVMGDADDSYDFEAIGPLIDKLREGYDLVVGNRFMGGIQPGAMPWSHRWVGNPVLTFISRVFFHAPVGDTHCGLRAFKKDAYEKMRLRATGMEFASEMVIKASLRGMRITEVPVVLRPDGRSRPPHLRTWRDGWRHLRFMLLFSPRWLFLYPGLALFAVGVVLSALLLGGPLHVAGVRLDIHTLLVAGFLALIGYQLVLFAVFTKIFAVRMGFHPPHPVLERLFKFITLEVGLLAGSLMVLAGIVGLVLAVASWQAVGFGNLNPSLTMREVIPAVLLLAIGTQTVFASFFISILSIDIDGTVAAGTASR
ncbi:MAG TPA: glycosyltransferase family 2 protein [Candidatus Acidoferrum sp.]|jgi:glycosyltransferase involved in cell wall biosynthesis|nr:glycosyltransferase family 2 protein [Candidatus Acidoferrum sp.]